MSIVNKALEKMKESRVLEGAQRPDFAGKSYALSGTARLVQSESTPLEHSNEDAPECVVNFDRAAMRAAGVLPSEADQVASAEQYRAIKQDLIRYLSKPMEIPGPPCQFIMVASALPGDGKSFTSMNLALSIAGERDYDVLLIDGDLAMRHLTRSLSMAELPGLLDALRDSSKSFSSVTYATNISRLSIMPAGNWSEDASELIASERMGQLVAEIIRRNPRRIVVFDSSPVLLTPDARVLASRVGQVVLVVKAGTTLQHDVKEAVGMLSGEGRRITLVLNQIRSNNLLSSLVGYRYGYGYGARQVRGDSDTPAAG